MAKRTEPRKPAGKKPARERVPRVALQIKADPWPDRAGALARELGLTTDVVILRALDAFAASHGLLHAVPPIELEQTQDARPAPSRAPEPAAPDDEVPALAPAVRLYVHGNGRPPQEMIRDSYVIGSSNRADLWVNMPKIDTRHVKITRDGTRYFVEDLGSEAGTVLEGSKLTGRHEIRHEDSIFLAGYHRVRFYLLA